MTKIDTATTAQWVYDGAQRKLQEAAGLLQQNTDQVRAMNRQKSEELEAQSQRPLRAVRPGGIDTYA